MRMLLNLLSAAALAGCLGSAIIVFVGSIGEQSYKTAFFVCSLAWFALSGLRIYRPQP